MYRVYNLLCNFLSKNFFRNKIFIGSKGAWVKYFTVIVVEKFKTFMYHHKQTEAVRRRADLSLSTWLDLLAQAQAQAQTQAQKD